MTFYFLVLEKPSFTLGGVITPTALLFSYVTKFNLTLINRGVAFTEKGICFCNAPKIEIAKLGASTSPSSQSIKCGVCGSHISICVIITHISEYVPYLHTFQNLCHTYTHLRICVVLMHNSMCCAVFLDTGS